jgi:hypothetical protein
MSPYCWIHLQAQKHLRIKPSEIEDGGLGLYATDDFHKDEPIINYGGDRIVTHDADYGGDYVLELKDTDPYIYMDGKRSSKRIGAFANHPPPGRRGNARFTTKPDFSDGELVANNNIRPGQEIFVNYGDDYWHARSAQRKKKKRLTDDQVEEELERVMDLLPEGIRLGLPAWRRRRRNEARAASVLSDEWRARENRRQLAEAEAALAAHHRRIKRR